MRHVAGAFVLLPRGKFTEPMLEMASWIVGMEGRGDPHVCNLKEEEEERDDRRRRRCIALHTAFQPYELHRNPVLRI